MQSDALLLCKSYFSLIFSVESNTYWLHKVSDNGEESLYSRPKQGTKKPMQRNKTLLRITLWFTIDFLPSSWMVHLLSSTGPFIKEISIHILSQECYLMIFHCILSGVREACRLTWSFVACFVSASSQACSWTVVLSRDQWAHTVWHFLSSSFSSNFQQVQIHVSSGKRKKIKNSSISDFTSGR